MSAAPAPEPASEPKRARLGSFEFETDGKWVRIRAGGRQGGLPLHMFLRTAHRVLAHELALGQVIFYGGFKVHNLGDPMEGTEVKFSLLGEPPVEEVFPKEEARRFLGEVYERFQPEGYREWY